MAAAKKPTKKASAPKAADAKASGGRPEPGAAAQPGKGVGGGAEKAGADLRFVQVTQADLARLVGLDRHTVADRLEAVKATGKRGVSSCYPLGEALEAVIAGQATMLSAAKLRKETADAGMRELKLAREKGLLIEVRDVRDKQQKVFTKLFQRFAVQLPTEIKGQLFKCDTVAEVGEVLKHSISKVFNDIRHDPSSIF